MSLPSRASVVIIICYFYGKETDDEGEAAHEAAEHLETQRDFEGGWVCK